MSQDDHDLRAMFHTLRDADAAELPRFDALMPETVPSATREPRRIRIPLALAALVAAAVLIVFGRGPWPSNEGDVDGIDAACDAALATVHATHGLRTLEMTTDGLLGDPLGPTTFPDFGDGR